MTALTCPRCGKVSRNADDIHTCTPPVTDRDLMQQALEALEELVDCGAEAWGEQRPCVHIGREAVAALRERLARPNEFNPDWDAMAVMVEEQQRMAKRIEELEARQEQEPVALETVYDTIIHWDENDGKRSRRELARRIVALYTAPQPERQWVGLTDEEQDELWDGALTPYGRQQVRAIEAALKARNA